MFLKIDGVFISKWLTFTVADRIIMIIVIHVIVKNRRKFCEDYGMINKTCFVTLVKGNKIG